MLNAAGILPNHPDAKMTAIPEQFLERIESLGDNCELGFVMRNLKYEKGGLFRWTITPIDKLVAYLSDIDQALFEKESLSPFSPGMVIDAKSGFSFHSAMKSEKNESGDLSYIDSSAERDSFYLKEKSKIDYLCNGFKERITADKGSIYLVKANKGMDQSAVRNLVASIGRYSSKHVLVEVRSEVPAEQPLLQCIDDNHYLAKITRFAPYVAANDVLYEEWNGILKAICSCSNIIKRIG